jgi:hypothetical protein
MALVDDHRLGSAAGTGLISLTSDRQTGMMWLAARGARAAPGLAGNDDAIVINRDLRQSFTDLTRSI